MIINVLESITPKLTNAEKEKIIEEALKNSELKARLVAAMVEPIKTQLEYAGIGRKLLMASELPQGAMARYKRDIKDLSCIMEQKSIDYKGPLKSVTISLDGATYEYSDHEKN